MRVTTAFKHLVRLDGIRITGVAFGPHAVTVTVSLRRRRQLRRDNPSQSPSSH
jgi:hypothetical protein